jgi:excisionase family DNA binding protein
MRLDLCFFPWYYMAKLVCHEKDKIFMRILDRWLSMDEICQYLGASADTIYRWIEHNDMPASKVGRFWKFKKDKVDTWIEAGGAASNSKKQRCSKVKL